MYHKTILFVIILLASVSLHAAFDPAAFQEAQEISRTTPTWMYPYPELVDDLKTQGKTSLLLFTYGSLMDVSSAKRTLSESSLDTRRPAVAYGIKRVFDLDVAITPESRWCTPNNPKARAMLNIVPSPSSVVNGVLMDIAIGDIHALLLREEGYNLIPVVVAEWDTAQEEPTILYQIAYTFHAPQGSPYTNSTIMPRPGYYELTRNAAFQFGEAFSKLWFETTFLSNGQTPIDSWEQKVLSQSRETQATCP